MKVFCCRCGRDGSTRKIRSLNVSDGRFITDRDNKSQSFVAVLGSSMAEDLFGDASPVGETISINGKKFQVVGLLESKAYLLTHPTRVFWCQLKQVMQNYLVIPHCMRAKDSQQYTCIC